MNYSNKFANGLYGDNLIDSGRSVMFAYIGIAIGDLLIGWVSQFFQSRKKALLLFYVLSIVGMVLFFSAFNNSDSRMYAICAFLGFSTGYWAIFNQMAAEQFGTNLRATAATTIPNMVRGALPLINFLFLDICNKEMHKAVKRGSGLEELNLIREISHSDTVFKAWLNAESMLVASRIIESNTERFSDEKIANKKLDE